MDNDEKNELCETLEITKDIFAEKIIDVVKREEKKDLLNDFLFPCKQSKIEYENPFYYSSVDFSEKK